MIAAIIKDNNSRIRNAMIGLRIFMCLSGLQTIRFQKKIHRMNLLKISITPYLSASSRTLRDADSGFPGKARKSLGEVSRCIGDIMKNIKI